MLFNAIIHAESYHRLYPLVGDQLADHVKVTGAAWLSSIHVVRLLVKSANECKPYYQITTGSLFLK